MLRTRTGTGTQVLQEGETYPALDIVSLAGRSGFSRTANVHGFASTTGDQTHARTATQTQTQTATRSVAAGAPAPGDPDGSKTITAVEDDEKKKKKAKEDAKARRKREWAEKRAARKAARKEQYVCFCIRRWGPPPRPVTAAASGAGGSGGDAGPPRIVKIGNEEPPEKIKNDKKNLGGGFSKFNKFSGSAPNPGDPDDGGGSENPRVGKEKAKKNVASRDPDEKEGGCFGCLRLFRKKRDSTM